NAVISGANSATGGTGVGGTETYTSGTVYGVSGTATSSTGGIGIYGTGGLYGVEGTDTGGSAATYGV
ncbi:MAG TPA: hypothetical protein VMF86_14555, partial [Stellaceae bacterium]|nr:hypothetical protein [Stellaceae bacterium]